MYIGARSFAINSLAINSLAINSLAVKISCYQPHLQSKHSLSNSFTINSIAIIFICYQVSFAIRPQRLLTHLLSILSCNPQFCYQSWFAIKFSTSSQSFFLQKICKKMEKFLIIWNSSFCGNFAWTWNRLIVLPQVKVSTFKKILITTCISTSKTRHTIYRPPTGARNTETNAKRVLFYKRNPTNRFRQQLI